MPWGRGVSPPAGPDTPRPAQGFLPTCSRWSRSGGSCAPRTCPTRGCCATCCGPTPTRMCRAGARMTAASPLPSGQRWWPSSCTSTTWTSSAGHTRYPRGGGLPLLLGCLLWEHPGSLQAGVSRRVSPQEGTFGVLGALPQWVVGLRKLWEGRRLSRGALQAGRRGMSAPGQWGCPS